jgi:hypothetical protein
MQNRFIIVWVWNTEYLLEKELLEEFCGMESLLPIGNRLVQMFWVIAMFLCMDKHLL